jgi:hypothetical protein
MVRFLAFAIFLFAPPGNLLFAQTTENRHVEGMESVEHLKDFQVVEFRRYTTKPGERQRFAQYFDSFFPEAFEQLGAIAFGEFCERNKSDGFTWLRGFHTKYDRAIVNGAFYYGPLWREHSKRINDLLVDSDNVLLLRPLRPETGIPVLPAVDPVKEKGGPQGVVVALVFAAKPGHVDELATRAEGLFARYRAAGVREAGVLVTADIPNNFPQLPIRTDGPYLVWLGIVRDEKSLRGELNSLFEQTLPTLGTEFLRSSPEIVVLDPTNRSRLRWFDSARDDTAKPR